VTGFSYYTYSRWGSAYPVGDVLGDLLEGLIKTPIVYKKLVGMQIRLEGRVMGAFANLHKLARPGPASAGSVGDDRRGLSSQIWQDMGG